MAVWHLGFSSTKRGALYPDEAQRRRAVHALVAVAGDHLALFNIVKEHKHALIRKQGSIKKLGGDIKRALSAVSEEPLNDPWSERIEGTKHKEALLRYFLRQPSHHDADEHDALWTGSCFLDLAGARIIDGLRLQIWDLLPNVSRSIIYRHVGLPSVEPVPGGDPNARRGAPRGRRKRSPSRRSPAVGKGEAGAPWAQPGRGAGSASRHPGV